MFIELLVFNNKHDFWLCAFPHPKQISGSYRESLNKLLSKSLLLVLTSITHLYLDDYYLLARIFIKKKAMSENLTVSQQRALFEQMLSRQQLNVNVDRVVCLSLAEVCCLWAFWTGIQCWISGENFKAKPLSLGPLYGLSQVSIKQIIPGLKPFSFCYWALQTCNQASWQALQAS